MNLKKFNPREITRNIHQIRAHKDEDYVDYRIYRLNRREYVVLAVISAAITGTTGWLFYNSYYGVLLFWMLLIAVKRPIENQMGRNRQQRLRNEFRDVLYSFSSSFAAGAHMEEAMEIASLQLADIYGESSLMKQELTGMIRRLKETAGSDVDIWVDLAERSGLEDIEDFASVFSACRDAGGNLVNAVDRAATLIVDKINIENEMRALFAQKKTEGRMVGIMPLIMVLFLKISSPHYLDVMYQTFIGRILMTVAIIAIVYSIYLTESITRIEV